MKNNILKIVILLLSLTSAHAFTPDIEIERLKRVDDQKVIYNALIKLKKDNLSYIKKLRQEKSYKPDHMYYSLTLKILLEPVNQELKCDAYINSIKESFKSEWTDLEQPTHALWPVIKKICK